MQAQLIATIANSYYNLLTLDRQLDISSRTAESWAEVLRTYEAKLQVGEATEAAVAQARASKLSVEASVLTLQKQIRAQENSLSILLGRVPGSIERTTLDGQRFPDTLAVGVPCSCWAAVLMCVRRKLLWHKRSTIRTLPVPPSIRALP